MKFGYVYLCTVSSYSVFVDFVIAIIFSFFFAKVIFLPFLSI